MTDKPTRKPTRQGPQPRRVTTDLRNHQGGPAVYLDQGALYDAVLTEMQRRGLTYAKQVSDQTGLDRNSLGRFLQRGAAGKIVTGQRGGLSINAYLTLVTWVNGNTPVAPYGTMLRPLPDRPL